MNYKNLIIALICILLIILLQHVDGKRVSKRGIMDNINSGLKYAGQMFGINTAADVAELVAKAFMPTITPVNSLKKKNFQNVIEENSSEEEEQNRKHTSSPPLFDPFNPVGFMSGILRLLGFDNGKLGALAINGVIFIAQMIGNALKSRRRRYPQQTMNTEKVKEEFSSDEEQVNRPRMEKAADEEMFRTPREGFPTDWLLENPSDELLKLFEDVQDKKLPEYLTETVGKLEKYRGEGDCIKLLLCKSAPFVWGMQKSFNERIRGSNKTLDTGNEKNSGSSALSEFFKHLPDVEEYKRHGHLCEERYSSCNFTQIE